MTILGWQYSGDHTQSMKILSQSHVLLQESLPRRPLWAYICPGGKYLDTPVFLHVIEICKYSSWVGQHRNRSFFAEVLVNYLKLFFQNSLYRNCIRLVRAEFCEQARASLQSATLRRGRLSASTTGWDLLGLMACLDVSSSTLSTTAMTKFSKPNSDWSICWVTSVYDW